MLLYLESLRFPTILFLAPTAFALVIWLIQTTNEDVKRYDNDFLVVVHALFVALSGSDVWFLRGDIPVAQHLLSQAELRRTAGTPAGAERASRDNTMKFVYLAKHLPSVAFFHRISWCTQWVSMFAVTFAGVDLGCGCTGEDSHGTFVLVRIMTLMTGLWGSLVMLYREFFRIKKAKVFGAADPTKEIFIRDIVPVAGSCDQNLKDTWEQYRSLDWFAANVQFLRHTGYELEALCKI